jgi:hypothetical protein
MNTIENLSFATFVEKHPGELEADLVGPYTDYLIERRKEIADFIGVSQEDLHCLFDGVVIEPINKAEEFTA